MQLKAPENHSDNKPKENRKDTDIIIKETGVWATHLTKGADVSGKIEILDSRFHGNDRQKSEEQKRETASRFLFAMGFVRTGNK